MPNSWDLPCKQGLLNYLDSHPSAAVFQIATWSSFPHMELTENIYSLQLNRIISWSRESMPVLLFHDVFSWRSENVEALRQKNARREDDTRKLHNNATLSTLTFKPFTFLIAEFFRQAHTPDAAGSSRESRVRSSDLCPWPVLGGACKSVKATTGKTCTSWCGVRGYKSAVWLDTRRRRVDFLRDQEILGLPETAVKGKDRGNNNHTILLLYVWAFEDLFVDRCIQSFKVVALTQLQC